MSFKRVRILPLGAIAMLGAVAACSSGEEAELPTVASANPANVAIELYSTKGTKVGSCAGTLIGPRTVLTAGHCVAGMARWRVTQSGGSSQTATGIRGYTHD